MFLRYQNRKEKLYTTEMNIEITFALQDDILLLAQKLETMVLKLNVTVKGSGLKLNPTKTKIMSKSNE